MNTIWKYDIPFKNGKIRVAMPKGAHILKFDWQGIDSVENLKIWVIVDSEQPYADRYFRIYGTGSEIDVEKLNVENGKAYIGSAILMSGRLVYHLFEVI